MQTRVLTACDLTGVPGTAKPSHACNQSTKRKHAPRNSYVGFVWQNFANRFEKADALAAALPVRQAV